VNRRFTAERKVRLGDVDRWGRLRLDALARYLQDVANDDAVDAGERPSQPWVVRRVALSFEGSPRLHDTVRLTTWCSGVGARWAERTTVVETGDAGGGGDAAGRRVESVTLWVYVDPRTLVPARLPERFFEVWGIDGLPKVRGRLTHDDPPPDGSGTRARWRPWPLRRTDMDILAHVNNAAYWEPVEEAFGGVDGRRWADLTAAELEYRVPITPDQPVSMGTTEDGRLWLVGADQTFHASAVVRFA
jgi:acyl-ACP thioesterase